MFRITALLFHGIYSLVAKRQPHESFRAEKATWMLSFFYGFVSFDLLLIGEKILDRLMLPGRGALLLLLLGLVLAVRAEVRYFKRHQLAIHLERYQHEKGRRRIAYALGTIPAFALVIAFPFSGIL